MATPSLFELPRFQTPEAAREHLESVRWPKGPICPHCGAVDRITTLKGKSHRPGLRECGHCRDQFTVTVGTVFERSKLPLNKWLLAATLFAASKKGISAHQLHRMLGITYKSAWFMAHRLREAMKDDVGGLLGGGGKTVEVDETYWGNKQRHKLPGEKKRGGPHKQMQVVTLVERGGKARSFQMLNVYASTLREVLKANVVPGATIHTDESPLYRSLWRNYPHASVKHSAGEYSRNGVTTNTVEGFFSILKRGLVGTFHHVGEQHLHRYIAEFDFRYSHRQALGFTDAERADVLLKGISGKRLTYRRTHA